MIKNIFITGDRSFSPVLAVGLIEAVIKDLTRNNNPGEIAIGTGNAATGIERAVRYLIPEDRLNVIGYPTTEDGIPDFEEGFKELALMVDEVVFIHTDPLASHIGRAVVAAFPPEKVSMPFQEVGMSL